MSRELINYLDQFTTEERKELFYRNIQQRTNYITVMLENIYQSQNASAVLRTCDCFGIQNVHIVENEHPYQINPDVTLGSDKWLNLNYYNQEGNNTLRAITHLKKQGFKIIATTPHTNDIELPDFDVSKGKFALMFGTELNGLSEQALGAADAYLKIPMYGFTESFNISVSAAITLHFLTTKLRESSVSWQLNEQDEAAVLSDWFKKSIKASDQIVKKFYDKSR